MKNDKVTDRDLLNATNEYMEVLAKGLESNVKLLKIIAKSLEAFISDDGSEADKFYRIQLEYLHKVIDSLENKPNSLYGVSACNKKAIG